MKPTPIAVAAALLLCIAGCTEAKTSSAADNPFPAGKPLTEATMYATPRALVTDPAVRAEANRIIDCPDSISWKDAGQHIGEHVSVYGSVKQAEYRPDVTGKPTFISLGADYPSSRRVSVVVFGQDRSAFDISPEELADGQELCVSGQLEQYNRVAQIQVTSPDQMVVVEQS